MVRLPSSRRARSSVEDARRIATPPPALRPSRFLSAPGRLDMNRAARRCSRFFPLPLLAVAPLMALAESRLRDAWHADIDLMGGSHRVIGVWSASLISRVADARLGRENSLSGRECSTTNVSSHGPSHGGDASHATLQLVLEPDREAATFDFGMVSREELDDPTLRVNLASATSGVPLKSVGHAGGSLAGLFRWDVNARSALAAREQVGMSLLRAAIWTDSAGARLGRLCTEPPDPRACELPLADSRLHIPGGASNIGPLTCTSSPEFSNRGRILRLRWAR